MATESDLHALAQHIREGKPWSEGARKILQKLILSQAYAIGDKRIKAHFFEQFWSMKIRAAALVVLHDLDAHSLYSSHEINLLAEYLREKHHSVITNKFVDHLLSENRNIENNIRDIGIDRHSRILKRILIAALRAECRAVLHDDSIRSFFPEPLIVLCEAYSTWAEQEIKHSDS